MLGKRNHWDIRALICLLNLLVEPLRKGILSQWIPTIFKVPGWGWLWLNIRVPFEGFSHHFPHDFILLTGWLISPGSRHGKKGQFHEPPIISLAGLLRYLFQVTISDFGPTIPYLGKVLASHLAQKTITYNITSSVTGFWLTIRYFCYIPFGSNLINFSLLLGKPPKCEVSLKRPCVKAGCTGFFSEKAACTSGSTLSGIFSLQNLKKLPKVLAFPTLTICLFLRIFERKYDVTKIIPQWVFFMVMYLPWYNKIC